MRFGCFFGGIFWGVLLVLLGIALLLNIAFSIRLPIFDILIGLFFVYLGVRVLIGRRFWYGHHRRWRRDDRYVESGKPGEHHDIIFGRGDIDLTHVSLPNETVRVEVNTVFGGSRITLDARMPVKIHTSSAFGAVRLPDGSATTFGEDTWKSSNLDETRPYLLLYVTSVFSGTRIVNQ
jgi:predicted membrane protein